MALRTTRSLSIGGRRYKAGDPIELSGRLLRVFTAIGYVEYGPEEYPAPPPAAEPVQEPVPKRRNYRRRDMTPKG